LSGALDHTRGLSRGTAADIGGRQGSQTKMSAITGK
jgi:hypothetical protein